MRSKAPSAGCDNVLGLCGPQGLLVPLWLVALPKSMGMVMDKSMLSFTLGVWLAALELLTILEDRLVSGSATRLEEPRVGILMFRALVTFKMHRLLGGC